MEDELQLYRERFREVIAQLNEVHADEYTIRQCFEQALTDYSASQEV